MEIYIETLGCPKNTVDSENLAGLLEAAGHTLCNNPENAEVIVINTCAFIHDAKMESIDTIFELASIKEERDVKIIVTGCLSQRFGSELFEEMEEIDAFTGVNQYQSIPDMIEQLMKEGEKRVLSVKEAPPTFEELKERTPMDSTYTRYLRIAEGCNNVCTYCVIPFIRGRYRSRSMENIIAEAEEMAAGGCKELVLIAQDLTGYGKDTYGKYSLSDLLNQLCKIPGIKWIRLMYCYEDSITEELIETIASHEKICKYIDLPLQHISDKILAAMNRRSRKASIINTIEKLRSKVPGIHIRTTFITGFPGETKEDFQELMEFVQETRFDRLGVFSYSKEEGTAAARMKGQIAKRISDSRRDRIMAAQQRISLEKNQEKVGQILEVLVEERAEDDNTYLGRTQYDGREIDNSVIFTAERSLQPGEFVSVQITDAFDYDLIGREV